MSHGAGDVALMRELDWTTRHRCSLSFLFNFRLGRQQRYYDAMSQKRGAYWVVRQAAIRELMGADELLMGTSASRRF